VALNDTRAAAVRLVPLAALANAEGVWHAAAQGAARPPGGTGVFQLMKDEDVPKLKAYFERRIMEVGSPTSRASLDVFRQARAADTLGDGEAVIDRYVEARKGFLDREAGTPAKSPTTRLESVLRTQALTFGDTHPVYGGAPRPQAFDFPPEERTKPTPKAATPKQAPFTFGTPSAASPSTESGPSTGISFGLQEGFASPKKNTPPSGPAPSSGFSFGFGASSPASPGGFKFGAQEGETPSTPAAASRNTAPAFGFTFGSSSSEEPASGPQKGSSTPSKRDERTDGGTPPPDPAPSSGFSFGFGASSPASPGGFKFGVQEGDALSTFAASSQNAAPAFGFTLGAQGPSPAQTGGVTFGSSSSEEPAGGLQKASSTPSKRDERADSDSDEEEESDPDRFSAQDQRNHEVLMGNPLYASLVKSNLEKHGPINVRTDTSGGGNASWSRRDKTIRIGSKMTGARRASAMVFEMTNAHQSTGAEALDKAAGSMTENAYAIEQERIEFEGIKMHHAIMAYGVEHLGWPPAVDRFKKALSGNWATFDGYLATQERTGHTNLHRSNHKIVIEAIEREADRAKKAASGQKKPEKKD
jgi:hypothetical protein